MNLFKKSVRIRTSLTKLNLWEAHFEDKEPDFVQIEIGIPHTYIVIKDKVEKGYVCILVCLEVD